MTCARSTTLSERGNADVGSAGVAGVELHVNFSGGGNDRQGLEMRKTLARGGEGGVEETMGQRR